MRKIGPRPRSISLYVNGANGAIRNVVADVKFVQDFLVGGLSANYYSSA